MSLRPVRKRSKRGFCSLCVNKSFKSIFVFFHMLEKNSGILFSKYFLWKRRSDPIQALILFIVVLWVLDCSYAPRASQGSLKGPIGHFRALEIPSSNPIAKGSPDMKFEVHQYMFDHFYHFLQLQMFTQRWHGL